MNEFKPQDVLWRVAFSMLLVFLTFNPSGRSYYHWLADGFPAVQPLEVVAGIVLLGLWIFFVKSTLAAMGTLGVGLLLALFGAIVWWMVSRGWLDIADQSTTAWVVLTILALVLGIGMSWSHIRRRVTGMASVDEVGR